MIDRDHRLWWLVAALCALFLGSLWLLWRPPPPQITTPEYLAWAQAEIDPLAHRLKTRTMTAEDVETLRSAMESGVQRKQVAALGVLSDLPRIYPESALRARLRSEARGWRVRIEDAPLAMRWEALLGAF